MSVPTASPRAILARLRSRTAAAVANQRLARKALVIVAGAVTLALGPVSGTAAFWTGSATSAVPALTSGSVSAAVTGLTGLGGTYTSNLLARTAAVVLSNQGASDAAFTTSVTLGAGSSTTLAGATNLTVWKSTGSCTATTSPVSPVTGTWASVPQLTGTIPAASSVTYCFRTRIPATSLLTTASVTPSLTLNLTVPNTAWTSSASASATQSVSADTTTGNDYTDLVRADGAQNHWRLGESSGQVLYDWVGLDDAYAGSGLTRGITGALLGDANKATTFPNDATGMAGTRRSSTSQQSFAVEAWFQTTSTTGGKIVGFGSSSSGLSSSYDRHLYLDASGRINWGVWPNTARVLTTTGSYNDGQWHHVVGSLGAGGQELYVDGVRVGRDTATTSALSYSGYWRIGGDSAWSGDVSFDGVIDDVAVYGEPLTATQVKNHHNLSGRGASPLSAADPYGSTVYADSPSLFWRLGESSGTLAADAGASGNAGTYRGSVSKPVPGAVRSTRNTAASFNGTDGVVTSNTLFTNPQVYSLELWFNTTTTTGGKLIGFGDAQTGSSASHDRHIYLQNDGRIRYGIYPGSAQTVITPAAYNDGKWHHVVATQSSAGMLLYVDGDAVAWDSAHTTPQNYNGYWRVGGDSVGTSWPGIPSTTYLTAKIDEVAVYGTALSEAQIKQHYAVATGAPIAAYSSSMSGLVGTFNGSASSDLDGSITAYSWDFGDGSAPVSGATATRTYGATGYYIVGLTVTDNAGKTSTSYNMVYARDVTAPSTPGTPTVTVNDGSMVRITWNGSTDNVGVTGYDVYRNGVKIARSTDTTHTDSTIALGTSYSYTVRAVDGTENQSAASGSVSVTTPTVNTTTWYQVRTYTHSKCLTFTSTAQATLLRQYGCGAYAASNQNFRFTATSDGYYRVVFRAATGSVWDLPSSSTTDGTDIQLFPSHGGPNQQWMPARLADGSYNLTIRSNGKCLDLTGALPDDGTVLEQFTCDGTDSQRFTLIAVP